VTALDGTKRFCELNRLLCERTGLAEQISVVDGDARRLPFEEESFDAAWSQAVWQNIEEKARVAREIHRVLRKGGRFALFEVAAGPGGELHYPVPWADGATQSFLIPPAEMRELLRQTRFAEIAWQEGMDIQSSVQQAASEGHGMAAGMQGLTRS
jgi:sarcosine/dimethylglycine N-methyltransferase